MVGNKAVDVWEDVRFLNVLAVDVARMRGVRCWQDVGKLLEVSRKVTRRELQQGGEQVHL